MRIGVPKEIKVLENRVGLVPGSVREAVAHGHEVIVEHNAGQGIGMDDDAYRKAGARVVGTANEVFAAAEMIVKVKEPQAVERKMLLVRADPVHLPAPRAGPRPGKGARRQRRRLHRLRDGHLADGRAAAAGADVGSRRPDVDPGRRLLPREAARRPRHAAGRRARRRPGQGGDPRRRRRRLARGRHRAGDGRRRLGARPQHRGAARALAPVRPAAQHRLLDPRRDRAPRGRGRPRHRRRADPRRVGAQARLRTSW